MFVMRPVAEKDLEALLELTTLTGFGLTTLPRDGDLLRKRIHRSQRAFAGDSDEPGGENYLLVLEDLATSRVCGTAGMVSKIGGFEPFYAFRIETSIHESEFLHVRKEIQRLHLVAEHNGPGEVCSLFLAPDARKDDNGRLLSLSRFLFMAQRPQAFDPTLIAEIRGVIDESGRSAFWDAIGKHFFDIEFPKADYLSLLNKRFIADLMPKHPIYIPLLPPEAQQVIGRPHAQSMPALRLLESEGFKFTGMVDIFEGGPIIACPLADVRMIRQSKLARIIALSPDPLRGETYLLSNTQIEYRACKGGMEFESGSQPIRGVRISAECAEGLGLSIGEMLRFAPLRAPAPVAAVAAPMVADEPVLAEVNLQETVQSIPVQNVNQTQD